MNHAVQNGYHVINRIVEYLSERATKIMKKNIFFSIFFEGVLDLKIRQILIYDVQYI